MRIPYCTNVPVLYVRHHPPGTALVLYMGNPVRILPGLPDILTDDSRGFPLSFQANVGWLVGWLVRWVVGLFLLLPLGSYSIRETLRFTSVS
jgi:hypothetical protein